MIFWQSTGANVEIFQNIGKLFKGNALLTAFVEGELSMIEKKTIPSGKAILLSSPGNQKYLIQGCIRILFTLASKRKKARFSVAGALESKKKCLQNDN